MSIAVSQTSGREQEHDDVYTMLPRPFAWVLGFRSSAVWLGVAIAAGYLLAMTAFMFAGFLPGLLEKTSFADFVAINITYSLYCAAVPIVIAVLVRGLERDACDLAPALGAGTDEGTSLRRAVLTVSPRAIWAGAGFGLLVSTQTLWLAIGHESWDHLTAVGVLIVGLREIAVEVAFFGTLGWAVGSALQLSRLTEERARPDLLDPQRFAALARNGTRLAAVWLVLHAIGVPGTLALSDSYDDISRAVLLTVLALACLAGVALILPCRGAHRVMRSAKLTELEEVRNQIAEARRTREDGRLPGLLAWEARIQGLSDWPIDAATLGRTGAFVLLPVASWFASALVAHLVDAYIS